MYFSDKKRSSIEAFSVACAFVSVCILHHNLELLLTSPLVMFFLQQFFVLENCIIIYFQEKINLKNSALFA